MVHPPIVLAGDFDCPSLEISQASGIFRLTISKTVDLSLLFETHRKTGWVFFRL